MNSVMGTLKNSFLITVVGLFELPARWAWRWAVIRCGGRSIWNG
jgi:hypothetical protein